MRVVIAPDSFKGTLTATEVAEEIATGWRLAMPDASCISVPLADGGEGTVATLVSATDGQLVSVDVEGPYGRTVSAQYGLLGNSTDDRKQAVIEMAAASGLHLRQDHDPSPRFASTFGTGQLIQHALDAGVRHIILGLGGSATNDGGAGMAQALGVRLLTTEGSEVVRGGVGLLELTEIDVTNIHPAIADCVFEVACDVDNPLTGPKGASKIFGPQKGATPNDIDILDQALSQLADVVATTSITVQRDHPGAGAAGGLGFGTLAFLNAKLRPGIEIVMHAVGFASLLENADLVVTGEGKMDGQTMSGKAPFGVLQQAKKADVPALAIVGTVGPEADKMIEAGMVAIFDIVPGPTDLEEALKETKTNLRRTARNVASLWSVASKRVAN